MFRLSVLRGVVAGSLMAALGACGDSSPDATPTTPSATVTSITTSGMASLTTAGQTSQLTATATMSDGTTQNITTSAAWQSSNAGVATVSIAGLVTAVAAGTTTITATSQSKAGTLAVTVFIATATSTFQGTLAGTGGQSGTFTVAIQSAVAASVAGRIVGIRSIDPATATMTVNNGVGTFTLAGDFDTSTSALNLSGSGFVLTGATSQGAVSGTYTGPNSGTGKFSGLQADQHSVTQFCGTWSGSDGEVGVFNLQVSSSGAASGVSTGGAGVLLTGQLNGTALTVSSSDGVTATGVVQGGTMTGTFGTGGTFTGSTSACL